MKCLSTIANIPYVCNCHSWLRSPLFWGVWDGGMGWGGGGGDLTYNQSFIMRSFTARVNILVATENIL